MNKLIQIIVTTLLVSFASMSVGFAQETSAPEQTQITTVTEPTWEPWELSTVGYQLLSVPLAAGVAWATGYAGGYSSKAYEEIFEPKEDLARLFNWSTGGALLGYTLSQGLFFGLIGDHMGGDGGVVAPLVAGGLNLALWSGVLYFGDIDRDYYEAMLGGFVATTILSQLVAYHISASLREDAPASSKTAGISSLSFGLAPTQGGASAGLSFQF